MEEKLFQKADGEWITRKIWLNDDRVPSVKNHDYFFVASKVGKVQERYILYSEKTDRSAFHCKVVQKTLKQTGNRVFPAETVIDKCGYANGKVYGKTSMWGERDLYIKELIVDIWGLECLLSKSSQFIQIPISKTLLKEIFLRKITNKRDLLKRYLYLSYRVKGADIDLFDKVGQTIRSYGLSVADIRDFTTDFNLSLKRLLMLNDKRLFVDLIMDCRLLNKRVNPKWSERRMKEEHQKNNRLIMDNEIACIEYDSFNDYSFGESTNEIAISHINHSKDAYVESKEMNHCIYYNYLRQLKQCSYVAFKVTVPVRCTVGLIMSKDKVVVDQIRGENNRLIGEMNEYVIKQWLYSHTEEIGKLFKLTNTPKGFVAYDEDMPF